MGDVISFGKEKRKRESAPKLVEVTQSYVPVKTDGWESVEAMLREAADDLRDGKVSATGACIVLYSKEATTLYRRRLSVDELAIIVDDFWNAVANVFDPA